MGLNPAGVTKAMKRFTHPFLQLLVMLVFSLVLTIGVSLVSAVLTFSGVDMLSTSNMLWLQAVTQLLVFAVPVLIVTLIYYRGSQRAYYRLDFSRRSWLAALTGVVVMMLVVPVNEVLTEWNDGWDLGRVGELLRQLQASTEGIVEQFLAVDSVGGLLVNLLVVAAVPAICEELFFRAGIQNLLQRWWNPSSTVDGRPGLGTHLAIVATAVIFSLGHGEVFSFVPRLLLGLILGYLYIYSGSLLVNVTAHFVNNAVVVLLYWLVARGVLDIDPEAPIHFGLLPTVCATLATVMLMVVTFGKRLKDS